MFGLEAVNQVGLLQEKCWKANSSLPKYVEDESGPATSFKCLCILNEWKTEGIGFSKKSAKQNAAKLMLELLESKDEFECLQSNNSASKSVSGVSKLFEYCSREKLKCRPLYSEKPEEDGLSVIECNFNGFSAIAKERNKKKAKEMASNMVIKHFEIDKYFDHIEKVNERLKDLKPPVTELQELCQSKKLSIHYTEASLVVSKKHVFEFTCTVGELKTKSSPNISKKEAKNESAKLMLTLLNTNTPASSPGELLQPNKGDNTKTHSPIKTLINEDDLPLAKRTKSE